MCITSNRVYNVYSHLIEHILKEYSLEFPKSKQIAKYRLNTIFYSQAVQLSLCDVRTDSIVYFVSYILAYNLWCMMIIC